MGLYKYVREAWKKPKANLKELWKERLIEWRRDPATLRIERPTRIDRARSLGYKAKQGYVIVRERVPRGGRMRARPSGGRRSKHSRQSLILTKNYQSVAEQRANKLYQNCEVLNSYLVAKDGKHYWYEVILVDRSHPAVLADPRTSYLADGKHRGRVYRGKTASERRARGLLNKGKGAEKFRPSKTANWERRQD